MGRWAWDVSTEPGSGCGCPDAAGSLRGTIRTGESNWPDLQRKETKNKVTGLLPKEETDGGREPGCRGSGGAGTGVEGAYADAEEAEA